MNVISLLTTTFVLATTLSAFGQEPAASNPTALSQLLAGAAANNPQISAANHGVRAARQIAPQVTTLPDPKFTLSAIQRWQSEAACRIHGQRLCLYRHGSVARTALPRKA